MDEKNRSILSVDEEERLLAPIDEYVGSIQQKVNALRADGTDIITLQYCSLFCHTLT